MILLQGIGDVLEDLVLAVDGLAAELARVFQELCLGLVQCIFIGNPLFGIHFHAVIVAVKLIGIVDAGKRQVQMTIAAVGNDGVVEDGTVQ